MKAGVCTIGGHMTEIEKFRGALLGGACGDALGYPLQGLSVCRIQHKYGPFGLRTLVRNKKAGNLAPVTENTQLALATIDGLLWADAKKMEDGDGIYRGYMRWFYSQTGIEPRRGQKGWMRRQPHEKEICLIREKFMHFRRNSEEGLLNAFAGNMIGTTKVKVNDSKGSAVLQRAVPIGLLYGGESKAAFDLAVRAGAYSHSNPTAYYSAGALAALISCLVSGLSFPKSLERVHNLLNKVHKTESITTLLSAAETQANDHPAGRGEAWDHVDSIHSLGSGDMADEALAIAVYCCLASDAPLESVVAAANHGGNSSASAGVTGAIQGVRFGPSFIPVYWSDLLEGKETILGLTEKFYHLREKKLERKKNRGKSGKEEKKEPEKESVTK